MSKASKILEMADSPVIELVTCLQSCVDWIEKTLDDFDLEDDGTLKDAKKLLKKNERNGNNPKK